MDFQEMQSASSLLSVYGILVNNIYTPLATTKTNINESLSETDLFS